MESLKTRYIILISIISFLCVLFYNELNIYHIKKLSNYSIILRSNETIATADDVSYIIPPENFINNKGWKTNDTSKQSYFFRSPGYGIWYGLFYYIFGSFNYLFILKIAQLILFSISVFFLIKITYITTNSTTLSYISGSIYGILPFSSGFLYYTLTESISPSFMILFAFFCLKIYYNNKNKKDLVYALIIGSFLMLIRPILGLMIIGFIIALFERFKNKTKLQKVIITSMFTILLLSPTIAWEIRKTIINNDYPGLHPVYCPDNNNEFRPQHESLWLLVNKWGVRGDDFHKFIRQLKYYKSVEDLINTNKSNYKILFPDNIIEIIGFNNIKDILSVYKIADNELDSMNKRGSKINSYLKSELTAKNKIDSLKNCFIKENIVTAYIVSPIKYFKQLIFHSNMSLYIYQVTYRGNWFVELTRIISFLLMILITFSAIIGLFLKKQKIVNVFFFVIPTLYIVFICFVFRGIEERYILPFIPLMLISFILFIQSILSKIRL